MPLSRMAAATGKFSHPLRRDSECRLRSISSAAASGRSGRAVDGSWARTAVILRTEKGRFVLAMVMAATAPTVRAVPAKAAGTRRSPLERGSEHAGLFLSEYCLAAS